MKLMIDENDFDNEGRPAGAFKRLIATYGDNGNHAEVVPIFKEPKITLTTEPAEHQNDPPPPKTATTTVAPPKRGKKRRSKAEIAADDDAACIAEIKAAAVENREPDRANLPADTRKRVGSKPQSWIDPQQYAAIMQTPCAVVDDPPPITATQGAVDPEPLTTDPNTTDFSDFLEPETDHRTEAELRFKIGSTLNQLAQLNRPAAQEIIKGWKTQYNTTQLPQLPADALVETLTAIENALDNEQPPEAA